MSPIMWSASGDSSWRLSQPEWAGKSSRMRCDVRSSGRIDERGKQRNSGNISGEMRGHLSGFEYAGNHARRAYARTCPRSLVQLSATCRAALLLIYKPGDEACSVREAGVERGGGGKGEDGDDTIGGTLARALPPPYPRPPPAPPSAIALALRSLFAASPSTLSSSLLPVPLDVGHRSSEPPYLPYPDNHRQHNEQ